MFTLNLVVRWSGVEISRPLTATSLKEADQVVQQALDEILDENNFPMVESIDVVFTRMQFFYASRCPND